MVARQVIRQRDFSAGELDEYAERSDEPLVRAGGRQMSNWRIMTPRAMEYRCGRRVLFPERGRTEEIDADSDTIYRFCFGQGTLKIRDSLTNAIVAGAAGFPWDDTTVQRITLAHVSNDVVISFPNMRPIVARWDGASAWTIQDFAFAADGAGIDKVPFARIAKRGITMLVSAVTGTVNITFSDNVLTANHVGSLIRWANKRLRVASVASGLVGTAVCLEPLLIAQKLTVTSGNETGFAVGDAVIGSVTETEGVVVSIDASGHFVYVQLLNFMSGFTTSDVLIGPFQRTAISGVATADPQATTVWDEQVFGDAYGWPQSCTADLSRLIFCDIPSLPEALCESAVGTSDDFDVGTLATSAICELITGKPRIYHVMGGSDQFLFTSKGIYYIPISESSPLAPGSITFRLITSDAAGTVRPVATADGLAFINASGTRVIGILQTGQVAQPYAPDDLAEWHSHLIVNPIAIMATSGDGEYPERYLLVLNGDGSVAVGRFDPRRKWWGWLPWTPGGGGLFKWVASRAGTVLFTTKYTINGTDVYLVEQLDKTAYLDAQVPVNAVPAALAAQTESALDYLPTAGTAIGNMTANGGLTALDDGDTTKTVAQGAKRASTSGFYGRQLAVAQPVKQATCYASSDAGWSDTAATITFELRASNTAPDATGSNGTLIGTTSAIDTNAGVVALISTDAVTPYLYHWIKIADATAGNMYMALATFTHPGASLGAPSGGAGNLWMFAGGTVNVMDGLFNYSTRAVDASGNLTSVEGDDLSALTVEVGFSFEAVFEPFIPHAPEGQSSKQALHKRNLGEVAIKFQKSTGFDFADTTIAAYKQGEDQAQDIPQREGVETFAPKGLDFDPRNELSKDTPGTLRVLEVTTETDV